MPAWHLAVYLGVVTLGLALLGLLGAADAGPGGRGGALLLAALAAGWAVSALEGRAFSELGFGLDRGVVRGTLGGLALGLAAVGALLALLTLAGVVAWSGTDGGVPAWLGRGGRTLALLGLAAAAEEALVRGYPLQLLTARAGPGAALLATSAAFGALHLGNPGVGWIAAVNVAAAGVALGVLALRTGSLWWATGAHLGWNWGQAFLADLPVSGLELVDTPFWEAVAVGPTWLSGGGFGVEGSALAAPVLAAAAWWAWRTPRLRPEGPRWWWDETSDDEPSGTPRAPRANHTEDTTE